MNREGLCTLPGHTPRAHAYSRQAARDSTLVEHAKRHWPQLHGLVTRGGKHKELLESRESRDAGDGNTLGITRSPSQPLLPKKPPNAVDVALNPSVSFNLVHDPQLHRQFAVGGATRSAGAALIWQTNNEKENKRGWKACGLLSQMNSAVEAITRVSS